MNKSNIFKPRYWLSHTKKVLTSALERFPLSIAFFLAFAILLIYQINLPFERVREYREVLNRLFGSIAFGAALSMAVKVLLERLDKGEKEGFIAGFLVIFTSVLFYLFLLPEFNTITVIRLIFSIVALLLAFIFIPYFLKRDNFESYVAHLISVVATTAFFSIVLGLGVTALIFAIRSLLIENLSYNYFAYTWIITGFVFAPTYFFYALPKHDEVLDKNNIATPLRAALIYLVLPLLGAYTVVLYLYFARILLTWNWPSGIVSYLVSSYAAIGIVAVFLSWPFKDNKWVDTFIKVYTKAIFPLLAMMFVAIYLRINQHGITENRYFIVAIGLWATFAIAFINLDKGKRNIILVTSLAAVLILTSYGPLSATSLTIRSQNSRFEELLLKNDMLENNEIIPNPNVSETSKRNIISIIEHFHYNYGTERLLYFPDEYSINELREILGFDRFEISDPSKQYFSYFTILEPFEITGYDLLIPLEYYRGTEEYIREIEYNENTYIIKIDDNQLIISANDNILITISLYDHAIYLNESYSETPRERVSAVDLAFEHENENVKVKIVYNSFHGAFYDDLITIREIGFTGNVLLDIK